MPPLPVVAAVVVLLFAPLEGDGKKKRVIWPSSMALLALSKEKRKTISFGKSVFSSHQPQTQRSHENLWPLGVSKGRSGLREDGAEVAVEGREASGVVGPSHLVETNS